MADEYSAHWRSEPIAQAAKDWLDLADHIEDDQNVLTSTRSVYTNSNRSPALSALPSPAVWEEIASQLEVRLHRKLPALRDLAMLAMFEVLLGRNDKAWTHVSMFKDLTKDRIPLTCHLLDDIAAITQRTDRVESAYRFQASVYPSIIEPYGIPRTILVPDLVSLVGTEKARSILATIFRQFDGEIELESRGSFARFAQETALSMVNKLKHPQWALSANLDGAPLFLAMHKRFPRIKEGAFGLGDISGDTYFDAAWKCVNYLVTNDRTEEAWTLFNTFGHQQTYVEEMPPGLELYIRRRGKAEAYLRFLERLVLKDPRDWIVDYYFECCEELGAPGRADRYLARAHIPFVWWQRDLMYDPVPGMIEGNRAQEAAKLLFQSLQPFSQLKVSEIKHPYQGRVFGRAHELYRIGRYLHRTDYMDFAIAMAEKLDEARHGISGEWIWQALIEDGHASEAEALLTKRLLNSVQSTRSTSFYPKGTSWVTALLNIYLRAGKYVEIIDLLTKSPNLGETDLKFLDGGSSRFFVTAKALAAVGRLPEAEHVAEFSLQKPIDADEPYELLLNLNPTGAGEVFDRLHLASPMATRPLIWRAEWLRRQGHLDEARITIHQAIDLDPQDTQSYYPTSRYQAWAILSDIERDLGHKDAAARSRAKYDIMRKWFPGDSSSAYWMNFDHGAKFRGALKDNPDDIQMRFEVAKQLVKQGNDDLAKAQALEACSKLTTKIGPASNVDFMFESISLAKTCLDSVLRQIREQPKNSVLRAVAGKLYAALGEAEKAKQSYLDSVALNADNYLAWDGLNNLRRDVYFDNRFADQVNNNLVRLDPLKSVWQQPTYDFRSLWSNAEKFLQPALKVKEPIFTLPASKEQLKGIAEKHENLDRAFYDPRTAGDVVQADRTIGDFVQLIRILPQVSTANRP